MEKRESSNSTKSDSDSRKSPQINDVELELVESSTPTTPIRETTPDKHNLLNKMKSKMFDANEL